MWDCRAEVGLCDADVGLCSSGAKLGMVGLRLYSELCSGSTLKENLVKLTLSKSVFCMYCRGGRLRWTKSLKKGLKGLKKKD